MKNLFFILFATATMSMAKPPKAKVQEIVYETSAECGDCKERIEGKLNYTKGIVFADLDYKTQKLTVKFKTDKISSEDIKKIVSELGYDIDDVKANPEAQAKLPSCCQPGGMHQHKGH